MPLELFLIFQNQVHFFRPFSSKKLFAREGVERKKQEGWNDNAIIEFSY